VGPGKVPGNRDLGSGCHKPRAPQAERFERQPPPVKVSYQSLCSHLAEEKVLNSILTYFFFYLNSNMLNFKFPFYLRCWFPISGSNIIYRL
jgi:hypothetical protein